METLLIAIGIIYSLLGFLILIYWLSEGYFIGVSLPRKLLAIFVCGPIVWMVVLIVSLAKLVEKYILGV